MKKIIGIADRSHVKNSGLMEICWMGKLFPICRKIYLDK